MILRHGDGVGGKEGESVTNSLVKSIKVQLKTGVLYKQNKDICIKVKGRHFMRSNVFSVPNEVAICFLCCEYIREKKHLS